LSFENVEIELTVLPIVTVAVSFGSDYLVGSIETIGISKNFIRLILSLAIQPAPLPGESENIIKGM
jgi:hypothetical protein